MLQPAEETDKKNHEEDPGGGGHRKKNYRNKTFPVGWGWSLKGKLRYCLQGSKAQWSGDLTGEKEANLSCTFVRGIVC